MPHLAALCDTGSVAGHAVLGAYLHPHLNPRTRRARASDLAAILDFAFPIPFSSISRRVDELCLSLDAPLVERWVGSQKKLLPATLLRRLSSIATLLDVAKGAGLVSTNPLAQPWAARLRRSLRAGRTYRPGSEAESTDPFEAANRLPRLWREAGGNEPHSLRDRALLALLMNAVLPAEAIAVRMSDLSERTVNPGRSVIVPTARSEEPRHILLAEPYAQAVAAWYAYLVGREVDPDAPLVQGLSRTGTPMGSLSTRQIQRIVWRASASTGSPLTARAIRSAVLDRALRRGASLADLQELTGVTDPVRAVGRRNVRSSSAIAEMLRPE